MYERLFFIFSTIFYVWLVFAVVGFLATIFFKFYYRTEYFNEKRISEFPREYFVKVGTVVGYKKLVMTSSTEYHSPLHPDFTWIVGKNVYSDEIPSSRNSNGIYITKSPFNKELDVYSGTVVKVICENAPYIEYEDGYRISKGRII